jgi:hypothetical protein
MDHTTLMGTLMQATGTVLVSIPIWDRAWAFDTTSGSLADRKGRWPWLIRIGLLTYLLGYGPILWAMIW